MARIQFILRHRDNSYSCDSPYSHGTKSSGLLNSARFAQEMLRDELGHTTELIHAHDNNDIDRLVTRFKPDICVLEAYWVVPDKFAVLSRLHPDVLWVVRNHSALAFLANEGVGIEWTLRYMDFPNVVVASNDARTDLDFRHLVAYYRRDWDGDMVDARCSYLPNYYPPIFTPNRHRRDDHHLDVFCPGAIRPLKNHLVQAVGAIEYAEAVGVKLRFHINSTRLEGWAHPILKSLRALFDLISNHRLVEHPWLDRKDFIKLVRKMDVGLQVSNSETFSIASADLVMNDVPVVVSPEVRWVDPMFHADPGDSQDIAANMALAIRAHGHKRGHRSSVRRLQDYDLISLERWDHFIQSHV